MYHGIDYYITGLNSLVVITSLLFALSQYFEKYYQSLFSKLRSEVEEYHFQKDLRDHFKAEKERWESLLNMKPPTAQYLVGVLFMLLLILIIGLASLWGCGVYYLWAGPMLSIFSWVLFFIAAWCGYVVYDLKSDYNQLRLQANKLKDALDVMNETKAVLSVHK